MLDYKEVDELVDQLVDSIAIQEEEGLPKSREKCANFLQGQAVLTSHLQEIELELAKLATLRDATYAQMLSKVKGANVTEKKINISNEGEYNKIKEQYEVLDARKEWVKGHLKIFENAHLLYRSIAREG